MIYFRFIWLIAALILCSCGGSNKDIKVLDKFEKEASEEKKFVKVNIPHSRIRSTPDLEGAVLERAKENAILEFLKDSTTFTSTVVNEGKKVESHWYKVRSERGNEGWIAGICIEFLSDEENKRVFTLREDEAMNSGQSKSSIETAPKIDSILLDRYRNLLNRITAGEQTAFLKATALFESVFQQKISATADIAFGDLLNLHEKILSQRLNLVNPAKYQYLENEIKNYGSVNMEVDATCRELSANALTFGLKKNGKVYLKQNYDFLMRKFLRMLSPAMQYYLEQLALESENPAMEDDEISAELTEIAAYAVFWDKFISKYPYFSLKNSAAEKRKRYTSILLNGSSKRPAFENGLLNNDFKESYISINSQMGLSPLIKSFIEYYKALEKANFKDNENLKHLRQLIITEH